MLILVNMEYKKRKITTFEGISVISIALIFVIVLCYAFYELFLK